MKDLSPIDTHNLTEEVLDYIQSNPDKFRLLSIVPHSQYTEDNVTWPIVLGEEVGDEVPVVFASFRTNGTNIYNNSLIEMCLVRTKYSKSAEKITELTKMYHSFNDPRVIGDTKPILTEEVVYITGLTNEMLANRRFDISKVEDILEGVDIVITNDAQFMVPFFAKCFPTLEKYIWRSYKSSIKWRDNFETKYGNPAFARQCGALGYFFDTKSLRAETLVMITLSLMIKDLEGNKVIKLLNSVDNEYQLLVFKAYDIKDQLKKASYKWDAEKKAWAKQVIECDLAKEKSFISSLLSASAEVTTIKLASENARTRFYPKQYE